MIIRYEKIFVHCSTLHIIILIRDYIFIQSNNKIKLQANIERVYITTKKNMSIK